MFEVPGAPEGPGGLIIICEDFLIYKGTKGDRIC